MFLKVKEFTRLSCEVEAVPRPLSYRDVEFAIGMILSETVELARTVCGSNAKALEMATALISTDYSSARKIPTDHDEILAEQVDAFVDIIYYIMNVCARVNIDLDSAFDIVHTANMRKMTLKYDPVTCTYTNSFIRAANGKILKPINWVPPDMLTEMKNQTKNAIAKNHQNSGEDSSDTDNGEDNSEDNGEDNGEDSGGNYRYDNSDTAPLLDALNKNTDTIAFYGNIIVIFALCHTILLSCIMLLLRAR